VSLCHSQQLQQNVDTQRVDIQRKRRDSAARRKGVRLHARKHACAIAASEKAAVTAATAAAALAAATAAATAATQAATAAASLPLLLPLPPQRYFVTLPFVLQKDILPAFIILRPVLHFIFQRVHERAGPAHKDSSVPVRSSYPFFSSSCSCVFPVFPLTRLLLVAQRICAGRSLRAWCYCGLYCTG